MADVLQAFPVLDKFKKMAFILMNISTQGLKVDKEFFKKNLMVDELTRNIFEHLYQKFHQELEHFIQRIVSQITSADLDSKDFILIFFCINPILPLWD